MTEIRTDENPDGTGDTALRDLGLTMMHPFFGEEQRLLKMLDIWDAWSDDVKDRVQLILIDDHGSPSVEEMIADRTIDYNLSVYRIHDSLTANMAGAVNLGMMLAATPWILTMDSDYSFLPEVMHRLLSFKPDQGDVYSFLLDPPRMYKGVTSVPHTNTFLLHKDAFIDINGFDEDFTGKWSRELQPVLRKIKGGLPAGFSEDVQGYGYQDNAFHHQLRGAGYVDVTQHGYVATLMTDDVVGKGYNKTNIRLNRGIFYAKREGEIPWSTDMLRFKWTRVIHNTRK